MYSNYTFLPYGSQFVYSPYPVIPYVPVPYTDDTRFRPHLADRQQAIRGQATWTDGGPVTECGIPWSNNKFMTVAVGEHTPYQCGQTLKVRNLSIPGNREVIVTVVDRVRGYPANRINLHRKAFEALGANLNVGIINVEIFPHPQLELEKWGKYLLEIVQTAYPGYNVIDFKTVGKTTVSPTQTKETFEYVLQSPQRKFNVRASVIYNPKTDRVISFDLKEVTG